MKPIVLAAVAVMHAAAATAAEVSPDPADPRARTPATIGVPPLLSASPDAEVDPAARWRAHNDRVRSLGGHAGHAGGGGARPGASMPGTPKPQPTPAPGTAK